MVLVYGDTYSTFMGALAASYCGIKVAHIEAGFRSGNFNMPEEFNRILTDRISAVRFCFTMEAFRNLNAEGLLDHTYFFKGDPMFDSMNRFLPIRRLKAYRTYDLVTMHRNFNVDNPERLRSILGVLGSIKWSFWFPVHPRTAKMLIGMKIPQNVKLMKPQSYKKMLSLESNARKIITDSGGVSREAYWMRIPQIILRKETEFLYAVQTAHLLGADGTEQFRLWAPIVIGHVVRGYGWPGEVVEMILDGRSIKGHTCRVEVNPRSTIKVYLRRP